MAVPLAVAYCTVTDDALAALRLTLKTKFVVPALPSASVTSPMFSVGSESSLVTVPVAVPVAMVALVGAERTTVKVSLPSAVVSPVTGTVIVREVVPAVKVSVPEAAV